MNVAIPTKHTVRISAVGLDNPKIRVCVVRETTNWVRGISGYQLKRRGDHFEGEVDLEEGDMFLVAITGPSKEEMQKTFRARQEAGLTEDRREELLGASGTNGVIFVTIPGNQHFPISFDEMPYPVNVVKA